MSVDIDDELSDELTGTLAESISRIEDAATGRLVTPGDRLGGYRIGRLLGQGGTGDVFLAYGVAPGSPRRVAVKVLQRGLGRHQLRQRFDNECHILSTLHHPNIARLYESRATDPVRPYVVMEYVAGERIDAYCDRRCLTVGERNRLVQAVCRAVAAAHHRRVIHLDLKPSNILVTADGVPKLLDFGIATLLEPGGDAPEIESKPAVSRPMTLGYASPEQIAGQPLTPRADVYALGMVLYKLLAGRLPFPAAALQSREERSAFLAAHRKPLAPSVSFQRPSAADADSSAQVSPDAEAAAAIARLRSTTPAELHRLLRTGLDAVVLQAIAHRPSARFASVGAFAAALRAVTAP